MSSKPVNYLSNKVLLREIELSKLSYCEYNSLSDTHFDLIIKESLFKGVTQQSDVTYRVVDYRKQPNGYLMKPFYHVRNGEIILRSHMKQGRITENLGRAMTTLTERYGDRPNWRNYTYLSEMKSNALLQMCRTVLRFDERLSNNPFSYLTQITYNSFLHTLQNEKRHSKIKDEMIKDMNVLTHLWRKEQ